MAQYDQNDFATRVQGVLPSAWFSTAAATIGSLVSTGIYGAVTQGVGNGFATVAALLAYAKNQTRLATATDSNLDAAASDFFNLYAGFTPRMLYESDAAFSARIRAAVVEPTGTLAAIQAAVQAYLGGNAGVLQTQIYQLFGLDTYGGLDTFGGLDGFGSNQIIIPQVVVFDQQSNPALSATLGITPPQFCVMLLWNPGTAKGFFVGRSYVSRDYMLNFKLQIGSALTAQLGALVNAIKATGTIPVFANNYH